MRFSYRFVRTTLCVPLSFAFFLGGCGAKEDSGGERASWGGDEGGDYGDGSASGSGTGGWGTGTTGGSSSSGGSSGGASSGGSSSGGTGGDDSGGEGGLRFDAGGGEPPPEDPEDPTDPTEGEPEVCDREAPVSLYLSPDDSNSMSSPVQVRAAVLAGWSSLGSIAVRPWEFFNYYRFAYAPPTEEALALDAVLRSIEGAEGEYLMQIGVTSQVMTEAQRPPVNLTFVLDSSGSMSGGPMDLLKATCRTIAGKLRQGDHVSMVTWNTDNAVILAAHPVDGPDDPELMAAIAEVTAAGGTDLNGGLTEGYRLAQEVFDEEAINRVVLISDGGANAGITDIDIIAGHAGDNDEDGIYMVGVGVGTADTYNDALMDHVTDVGKGASVFVPSAQEAERVFDREFLSTLAVAARDVRVRLDLPPGFKIVTFSGEEVSPDPTEIEPQHVGPNDSVVFHQRLQACAPELVTDDSVVGVTLRWKDAATFEERELAASYTFAELRERPTAPLDKGAALMAYVEALKTRASYGTDPEAAMASAMTALATAEASLPGDADLAEIRGVLEALVP